MFPVPRAYQQPLRLLLVILALLLLAPTTLADSAVNSAVATPEQILLTLETPPPAVHSQILTAVTPVLNRRDGSYSVELQLDPASLGRVRVHLAIAGLADNHRGKTMEPFLFTFPPRIDKYVFFEHEGEEFMFVLSGRVEWQQIERSIRTGAKVKMARVPK